jgi:hypothetical protein
MVVATEASVEMIDCREGDNALPTTLRANNRKLGWESICAELIDNSLEHSQGRVSVSFDWKRLKSGDVFRAVDNGNGSTEVSQFFTPGESVMTGRSTGNSTFGMGLFVLECCLSAAGSPTKMQVATLPPGSPEIITGFRHIEGGRGVYPFRIEADEENRSSYALGENGTSVTFSKIIKSSPTLVQLKAIADKLGRQYSACLRSGELVLRLSALGETIVVSAEPIPSVQELKQQTIFIDGHEFAMEWGVTTEPCRDAGCRLIYGGKFFEANPAACGDYRINRFYAAIRIPRTIGKKSMDILKRTIDHPILDELFDQCEELFRPELEESDAICRKDEDESQTAAICDMLSSLIIKPEAAGQSDIEDGGNQDLRRFRGRDPESKGVSPKDSGKDRKGSKRKGRFYIPDSFNIHWAALGEDRGAVLYQHEGFRVTFNTDCELVRSLRDKKGDLVLSTMAAGHIAKDIAGTDKQKDLGFSDGDFSHIYRVMMERICHITTVAKERT